ncbi:hypothetical protein D9758_002289 [Tetrapyrgos nigripes]|uniref:Uncharacterized protein n=1 Tax=Tetrapyrgos nigripes TaxID=182062 RepID=A0A8H5GNM9_9AGAR|nr:hypothetical protein D9758_002289 [Tetrapyrgos nigripes]
MPVVARPRARHVRKEPYLPSFRQILAEAATRQGHNRIERWPSQVFRTQLPGRLCHHVEYADPEEEEDDRVYYGTDLLAQHLADFDYVAPDVLELEAEDDDEEEEETNQPAAAPIRGMWTSLTKVTFFVPLSGSALLRDTS